MIKSTEGMEVGREDMGRRGKGFGGVSAMAKLWERDGLEGEARRGESAVD